MSLCGPIANGKRSLRENGQPLRRRTGLPAQCDAVLLWRRRRGRRRVGDVCISSPLIKRC
jgi:hypothetical protein